MLKFHHYRNLGTEESFMMTLRSGHEFPSRDTTPDSVQTESTLGDDVGE